LSIFSVIEFLTFIVVRFSIGVKYSGQFLEWPAKSDK